MKQAKRFFYQVFFWLIMWVIQWLLQESPERFVSHNCSIFLFQIVLIGILIFYTAPQFLFKEKYLIFGTVSIGTLLLFSYITIEVMVPEGRLPPPPHHIHHHKMPMMRKGTNISIFPPSRIFINFLLLTITYFLSTFLESFIYIKKKKEESILNKSENLETELKLLKSQINPHFLFNALNNIYALSAIDTTKTQKSISYLSNMLRYVLYECDQKLVPLKKEILYIEDYIKLFSLKSSKKYPIEFKVNTIDTEIMVAPMIFLPYVENAFKHSNIGRCNDCFIYIEVNALDKNSIHFTVKNSIPKQEVVKDAVGGIGLQNVKKRLAILYPQKHNLNIHQDKEKYVVDLTIQLDKLI